MSYLGRVFENASELVTIPNPLIFTGSVAFTGVLDLSGATLTGLTLTASVVAPDADDGAALGSTSLKWSDLFLASGAVINFNSGDVTITHSANALAFAGASSGYSFDAIVFPATSDGAALGSGTKMFSDLFLASGAVINFSNGDVTITHGTNSLAFAGASSGYTFDSVLNIAGTTASTSSTTGALICAGGMGIAGKAFLGETVVVTDAKAVIQGMNSFPKVTVTSLTSAATVALSAAQVIGGFIIDAVSEANAATLPAPADIVAAIPNCKVGTSFLLTYKNAASGAYTITVTANGASTIVGTATIAQNNTKVFQAVVTNITGSSEAVVFYSVGTLVH
jgi:hypothetical protein